MSQYLAFFGSSQGFISHIFDSNGLTYDFSESVQERGLLESSVFTTDNIQNKEILARYIFKANGKNHSLLKLYSFAQAANISRIDGCTIGVALISDQLIDLSKSNLDLLRVAKENFAKLSLQGLKFNKSDFQTDAERIWKAIVNNSEGNLLKKIATSPIQAFGTNNPQAYYVKNLMADAIKLNNKISGCDKIYFSEDLEHLKRAQSKWGADAFRIYWEQNNQLELYKDPVPSKPIPPKPNPPVDTKEKTKPPSPENSEIATLRSELGEQRNKNGILIKNQEKLLKKKKAFLFLIYSLSAIIILILVYFLFFANTDSSTGPDDNGGDTIVLPPKNLMEDFINKDSLTEAGITLLQNTKYIQTYKVAEKQKDSMMFYSKCKIVDSMASKYNLSIEDLKILIKSKDDSLKSIIKTPKTNSNTKDTQNKLIANPVNNGKISSKTQKP